MLDNWLHSSVCIIGQCVPVYSGSSRLAYQKKQQCGTVAKRTVLSEHYKIKEGPGCGRRQGNFEDQKRCYQAHQAWKKARKGLRISRWTEKLCQEMDQLGYVATRQERKRHNSNVVFVPVARYAEFHRNTFARRLQRNAPRIQKKN